jgi:hypothetical protein
MASRLRLIAVAALATLAAACGPHSGAANPDQAVHDAIAKLQSGSLKATFDGSATIDSSSVQNLPAEISKVLGQAGTGGSAKGTLDQESQARRLVTVTAGGKTYTVVAYDGRVFYSLDGKRFAEVPQKDVSKVLQQIAGFDITRITSSFSFHDAGSETQDGVTAEHYSAPVDSVALQKLATLVGGANSQAAQAIELAIPFSSIKQGSFDVWVDGSGNPVRVSLNASISVDVGRLAAAFAAATSAKPAPSGKAPSGTLNLGVALDIHLTSVGGGVSVAQPSPDPAAPTFPAKHGKGGSGASPSATP